MSYLVTGFDSGEMKLKKARELKIPVLTETALYEMIENNIDAQIPKKLQESKHLTAHVPPSQSCSALWSEKYAPKIASDLCYPMMYNKIKQWLQAFEKMEKTGMLLSGPPGIGKTTSVYVAAKELKYTVIELNASNQRSGLVLHEKLDHIIKNQGLFHRKNLILLDEVDGCERGGIAEVMKLIKKTKIPIICTCNDHWDQKLRPLVASPNVEALRAQRAPYTAMSNHLQKVLTKEGVEIPLHKLQEMILSNGHDYRSLLNNIQLWSRQSDQTASGSSSIREMNFLAEKDVDINLFDMAKAFFDSNVKVPIRDSYNKLRSLFFNSDLIPLFIQENYLNYTPSWDTSVYLSTADVLSTKILLEQKWMLSTPHFVFAGLSCWKRSRGKYQSFSPYSNHYESGVKFPSALGKGSTIRRNSLHCHEILSAGKLTTFSPGYFSLNVAPVIAQRLLQPFLDVQNKEATHHELLRFMQHYSLVRADIDLLDEIVRVNSKFDFPFSFEKLSSGTKAKITRDCTRSYLIERSKRPSKGETGVDDEQVTEIAQSAKKTQNSAPQKRKAVTGKAPKARRVKGK
uniref:AAA+ ATPase domain-containing protein n=1 Tax=Paramoeba aestuarina TaxID=180227 RepID=A0A7S4KWA9_9EUKA